MVMMPSGVIVIVRVVMMIVAVVVMPVSAIAKHPKHTDGEQDNQHARKESQPRFGLLDNVALTESKRHERENPDDNRVSDRGGDRERDGLRGCSSYGDDIGR